MSKVSLLGVLSCVATSVFGAAMVSDVEVRQRWPWNTKVDIYYTISGAEKSVSVKPTLKCGDETIFSPEYVFSGERIWLENGRHHLVWDPKDSVYAGRSLFPNLTVDLEVTSNPLYMIVDLEKPARSEGQVRYVSEDDLRAGMWGDWEENPYPGQLQSVIWTGVTANSDYKQGKLVLRYIPATTSQEWRSQKGVTSFTMGAASSVENASTTTDSSANAVCNVSKSRPQGTVTLTKGYWMGVFETTEYQWVLLLGSRPTKYQLDGMQGPVHGYDWKYVRGSNYDGAKWPQVGHSVLGYSFMAKLRNRTGLQFDLPTEAQWEFAARAGAEGLRFGELETVAHCLKTDGPAIVGSYKPNAWGLYDVLGNVREGTLSAYNGAYVNADFGTDPVGQTLGDPYRTVRGGGWEDGAAAVNLHYRDQNSWSEAYDPNNRRFGEGFRICLPAE